MQKTKRTYHLDQKKFQSLAKEIDLPKELWDPIFRHLEVDVVHYEVFNMENVFFKEEENKKYIPEYLCIDNIDFSKKEINRNDGLTKEAIQKARDFHLMAQSDFIYKIISEIREEIENIDCLAYLNMSKEDEKAIVLNIASKYGLKENNDSKIISWIEANTIFLMDREKAEECLDRAVIIAIKGLSLITNRFKTLELISKNEDILHECIWWNNQILHKNNDVIDDWMQALIQNRGHLITKEQNEDLMQIIGPYLYNQISIDNSKIKNKLKEYIAIFPPQEMYLYILNASYVVYIKSQDIDSIEYLFSELYYQQQTAKKLSTKYAIFERLTKDYIRKLFAIKLLDEKTRRQRLESNKDKLLDVLSEEQWDEIYELYIVGVYKKHITSNISYKRENYKIGLIGGTQSIKSFKEYSINRKNAPFFNSIGITTNQFKILSDEFKNQNKLKIAQRFISGSLNFIIAFETDHKTELQNLLKIYGNQIYICSFKGESQHFSIKRFEKILNEALVGYESSKEKII